METEKTLDQKLKKEVKKWNGFSIKLESSFLSGLPDRLILFPDGIMFFAEIKTPGKKPTPIQLAFHQELKERGYKVFIVDCQNKIDELIKTYEKIRLT